MPAKKKKKKAAKRARANNSEAFVAKLAVETLLASGERTKARLRGLVADYARAYPAVSKAGALREAEKMIRAKHWVKLNAPRRARATRKKAARKKAPTRSRRNPGRALIGAAAEKLYYRGGSGKPSRSRWVHDFETEVRVYGEPDGTIRLVPAKSGVRLWDFYEVKV